MADMDFETTGGTPGAENSATPESGGGDWGFLPEGLESLKEGHERPETFWANASRAMGLMKEQELMTGKAPASFVDAAQETAFWRSLGTPEAADGYALPDAWTGQDVPESISAQVNETLAADKEVFTQMMHEAGLTNKQAEKLFGSIGTVLAKSFAEETPVDPRQTLAEVWPKDTATHLDTARRGAAYLGFADELDAAGLSANPLVLKMAHALGELLGEDSVRGPGGVSAALPSGEAARQEMYTIIKSDAYRNNDPAAMKRVEALAARVNG